MKVETIVKFRDLKANKIREIGEQFIVSKERYEELERRKFVKEVKVAPVQPEKKEEGTAG